MSILLLTIAIRPHTYLFFYYLLLFYSADNLISIIDCATSIIYQIKTFRKKKAHMLSFSPLHYSPL
jgi:hypothetical protein